MDALVFIIIVTFLAWIYCFYNGVNDRANAIATTISTRAMSPHQAILMSAVLNIVGAFITIKVAQTIGGGIVASESMTQAVVIASLLGAVVWAFGCTRLGIPISITHSLVGGIMGAAIAAGGISLLQWSGIKMILLGMVFSPLAGFGGAYLFMIMMLFLFRKARPYFANTFFRRAQILSAAFVSLSHGTNDSQNAMGIITVALITGRFITSFKEMPVWVIISSGFFMGLGTYIAGWRVMKTMGTKLVKLSPAHGFSAETSSALVTLGVSLIGIPISTTHVVSTAIMGVGASQKLSAVRWGVARNIVLTWILTFPGSALIGGLSYLILQVFI